MTDDVIADLRAEAETAHQIHHPNIVQVCVVPHAMRECSTLMPLLQQHLAGQIRIIAHSAPGPVAVLPGVPSFADLGFPGMIFQYCHGLAVPAGTPKPIYERLHRDLSAAILTDAVRSRMTPDMSPDITSADVFTANIARETAALRRVIQARGITAG